MEVKTVIERYIKYCIESDVILNKYVPNSHLGEVFSEVFFWLECYDSRGHIELFNLYPDFIDSVYEVFTDCELSDEIVHGAYQMLREKKNRLRNLMKLLNIEVTCGDGGKKVVEGSITWKRHKRGSHAIYKDFDSKYSK